MTEYVWSEVRDDATRQFDGEVPHAQLEQSVLEVFEQQPARVVAEIPRVAKQLAEGRIRSGWAVLNSRLKEIASARNPVVTDGAERDRAVAKAERWIKNAGIHFDRESEVLEELYSPGGFISGMHGSVTLEPWADDDGLRERMAALWREQRPRGELTEAEAERRAAEQVLLRKRLAAEALARKAERQTGLEADQVGV